MIDVKGFMSLEQAVWITAAVIVASTYAVFLTTRRRQQQLKKLESIELDDLLLETNNNGTNWDSDSSELAGQQELKNVFDVKQSPPLPGVDVGVTSKEEDKKPFKSSYYYAHNQHRKTGGYSDGLKAEDYEMNKPKLLSTGTNRNNKASAATDMATTSTAQAATTAFIGDGNSVPINRYLWDDEGKLSGVAKIYIDTLPGKATWDKLHITKDDVVCKLVGTWKNGLIVQIRNNEERYHLLVPRMYGEVEEAKAILKPNKLIIKLMKKRNNKDNLRAWPQLSSTVPALKSTTTTTTTTSVQDHEELLLD